MSSGVSVPLSEGGLTTLYKSSDGLEALSSGRAGTGGAAKKSRSFCASFCWGLAVAFAAESENGLKSPDVAVLEGGAAVPKLSPPKGSANRSKSDCLFESYK